MTRSFYRLLRTALHALRRHMMRSLLTCLGIVIGVAAVIAMMEIGQGSAYMIRQTMATLGANVVQIDPSDTVKAGVMCASTLADHAVAGCDCRRIHRLRRRRNRLWLLPRVESFAS